MQHSVSYFPDRIIAVEDKLYLYFGGTAYLGMQNHADFHQKLFQSIQKWGTCYGSSRASNIQLDVFDKFESFMAKFTFSESSLCVPSGMLAGKWALESLQEEDCIFFKTESLHPTLNISEAHPIWINNHLNDLLLDQNNQTICVLADSFEIGKTTAFDWYFLEQIPLHKKVILLLDESHSIGIFGQKGEGLKHQIKPKRPVEIIAVASLAKAIGISCGIVLGTSQRKQKIQSLAHFVGASACNPAFAEALINSQDILQIQFGILQSNLAYLQKHLEQNEYIDFCPNYPVIYIKKKNVFQDLLDQNILITHFKYPTNPVPLQRIVITANHTQKDIDLLVNALSNCFQKL